MTALLPPNLLRLFAPRPQPVFLKPLSKDERQRGPNRLQGCGRLVTRIREEAEEAELQEGLKERPETKSERRETDQNEIATRSKSKRAEPEDRMEVDGVANGDIGEAEAETSGKSKSKGKEKARSKPKRKLDKIAEAGVVGQEAVKMRRELREKRKEQYKKDLEKDYRPQDDTNAGGDPYKTLFVSRLSKKATEDDLQKEFEIYGAIEKIRIVKDRRGKSKNYAFIVYERERDMKAAYKDAEGIPIHHKKILVDVERGRTVKGWKPRKLGGGLGGRPKPVEPSAAAASAGPVFSGRGGFRGGFRGGALSGGGSFRGNFAGGGRGGGDFGSRGGFRGSSFSGRGGGFSSRGGFQQGPPGGMGGGDRGYGPPGGGYGRGGFNGGGGGGRFDGPPNPNLSGPTQSNGFGGQYGGGGGGGGPPGGSYGAPNGPSGYGGGEGYDRDSKRPRY